MIKMKEVGFNEDLVQKSVMEMIQRRKLEYYGYDSIRISLDDAVNLHSKHPWYNEKRIQKYYEREYDERYQVESNRIIKAQKQHKRFYQYIPRISQYLATNPDATYECFRNSLGEKIRESKKVETIFNNRKRKFKQD